MDSAKVWIEPTRQYWISIAGDEHQSESWKLSIFTNNTNKKLRVGNPKRDIKKKHVLVGGAITILKIWIRQWEGWHPNIYEMEDKLTNHIYIYTIVISCYIPIVPSYCITVAKLLTKYRCHKHGYQSVLPYAFFEIYYNGHRRSTRLWKTTSLKRDSKGLRCVLITWVLQFWPEIPSINGEITCYFNGIIHSIKVYT